MAGPSSSSSSSSKSTKSNAKGTSSAKLQSKKINPKKVAKALQSKRQQHKDESITDTKVNQTSKRKNPLFVARKKNFAIGHDMLPNRNLNHCVKFPRYVILQRRLKTIKKRLQEPPQIYQFQSVVDASFRHNLVELMKNIAPESPTEKKIRIKSLMGDMTYDEAARSKKFEAPKAQVSFGLQEVTRHILQLKSRLVIIAANVEPVHMILYLPSLCVKYNIPYCIVSDRGYLGKLVHQKKVTCISINQIDSKSSSSSKSQSILDSLIKIARASYNDKYEETITKKGPSVLSLRAQSALEKKEKIRKAEIEKSKKVLIE